MFSNGIQHMGTLELSDQKKTCVLSVDTGCYWEDLTRVIAYR